MEKIMKVLLSLTLMFCLWINICPQEVNKKGIEEKMLQTDRDFSALSRSNGINYAFAFYAAEDAVLLRRDKMPIKGKEEIRKLFSKPDTSFTLIWEPMAGYVADSGELGYTYGTYTVLMKNAGREEKSGEGTYCSIWRKNEKGEWKYVLDTGNEGLK